MTINLVQQYSLKFIWRQIYKSSYKSWEINCNLPEDPFVNSTTLLPSEVCFSSIVPAPFVAQLQRIWRVPSHLPMWKKSTIYLRNQQATSKIYSIRYTGQLSNNALYAIRQLATNLFTQYCIQSNVYKSICQKANISCLDLEITDTV